MAIEIVSFPINSMVIFHSYVNVYQRVQSINSCGEYGGFLQNLGASNHPVVMDDQSMTSIETSVMVTTGDPPWLWVNYNELTTSSLEIIVSKGNHPQMALIQVSELL